MYYEEKIIDGVLCFRHSPNGQFQPFSPKDFTLMVERFRKQFLELGQEMAETNEKLNEIAEIIQHLKP